jgi:hypothetical protein
MNSFHSIAFCKITRRRVKALLCVFLASIALIKSYAINSNAVTGNWSSPASWVGGVVPTAGDVVVIVSGATITVDVAVTRTATTTVNTGAVLILGATLTSNGSSITINGTLNCGTSIINGTSTFTLANANTATLMIGNANGITTSPTASGSIQNTGTRSYGANATYVYNGSSNQVTGNGLPSSIGALTINNTGAALDNVVTLTTSPLEIKANPASGTLTLTQGIFKLGTTGVLNFNNNSSSNALVNNGGNLATTGVNGADGGTVVLLTGSGANFTISGSGVTHFYNLSFGTAVGNANRQVVQSVANSVVINGTLTMQDNQSKWANNSPIYGANATLYINNNNQGYTPGSGTRLEWMAMASGTIGTTAGFPNNVTLVNVGTSVTNGCGFAPSGTWSINGTLSIGDGTVNCFATLQSMTAFTCGGITIDHNSTLKHGATTTFTVKGNWRRQGSTIGLFVPIASGTTVIFGGSGTSAAPQTISIATGTETFGNSFYSSVTINNGTYVKMNSPVTLQPSNILTLSSGILETSATNLLHIRNTAVAGITGSGSSTTYINGPVKWDLALASKYTIPLGKGTVYLPMDVTPAAAATNTITVEAFNINSNGTPDGSTVTAISNTEYWSMSATGSFTSGVTVSAARTSGVGSFNMLAKSTTANGVYSAIGGTTGTVGSIAGITGGSAGNASPWYFVLAYGPLSINVTSTTYPSCTGSTGSVTVAGSGGVPPYTYNINSGSYQASGTFSGLASGTYIFGVKDNAGTVRTISVQLDALVITTDTGTCTGSSVQLQAYTSGAWSYSWSPATGLSSTTIANPVANPASTQTYTASAIIVDNTINLISNAGFESGATGYTSNYIHHTCGAYASSWNPPTGAPWPCNGNNGYGEFHNGIYKIVSNAQQLCTNLASFGPRTGSNMMVVDGPNSATYTASPYYFWSQTLTGLSTNTYYVFTYWVRNAFNGDPNDNPPIIKTQINGTDATGTATYPNPFTVNTASWTQISYLWYSGGSTTATIEMYDTKVRDASNDFAIDDMSFYITCNPSKTVTVTITPVPTLNVVSQPAQACIGEGATISLTGLTASSTFTVNYSINGVAQIPVTGIHSDASGNASFTTTALTAANNGQTLQVTSLINTSGHSNCAQTFTGKTVSLNVSTYIRWLNTGNSLWNNASNWCGGIPAATSNVIIPDYGAGATYPVITSGITGFANDIVISTNASVTISDGGFLIVSGTYTSSGTLINNGELSFNSSSAAQSFPGATGTIAAMNVLRINNTSGLNPAVVFNRSFAITGALLPDAGTVNVNDAFITLASTATATARVGQTGATSGFTYSGTGQFIVQRYFPARRAWRLVAAPIKPGAPHTIAEAWQEQTTGRDYTAANWSASVTADTVAAGFATQITGGSMANGFDQGLRNNPSIKYYNAGSWPAPANTNNTLVNSQEGWMLFVRGDRKNYGEITDQYKTPTFTTLRPRGQLHTGPKSITSSGFTVVGNPYASSVDYYAMTRSGAGWPAAPTYTVWDPYLGGAEGVGAFVTLTWDSDNNIFQRSAPLSGTGTSSYDNRYIPSGAAIMVDFPAGGTLQVKETDKVAANTTNAFRPMPLKSSTQMRIVLHTVNTDQSTYVTDGILMLLGNRFNNDADENDARKMGNFNENIVIEKGGKLLVIERRKPFQISDTVFLGQYRMQRKAYQLEFIPEGIIVAEGVTALLEDKYLGTFTPVSITATTKINFTITEDAGSAVPDRFRLIFKRSRPFKIEAEAYMQQGEITIKWSIKEGKSIRQYEIERSADGEVFTKAGIVKGDNKVASDKRYAWTESVAAPGDYYYRIKAVGDETTISNLVKIAVEPPGVKVFPNPVANGIIRLQMNALPTGVYTARLINASGNVVLLQSFRYNALMNTVELRPVGYLPKAVYQLELRGPKGFVANEKIFL